jgi:hypothetical protein
MLEMAFRNNFMFDTVQMPLNVMDAHYDSFAKLVLPVLVQHKIGVLGMKPLGGQAILRSGVVNAPECQPALRHEPAGQCRNHGMRLDGHSSAGNQCSAAFPPNGSRRANRAARANGALGQQG